MKKKIVISLALIILLISFSASAQEAIKVGWIGPMSGPLAKYGAHQAAIVAMEEINRSGGIQGRTLELLFEDAAGNGRQAAVSAQKLININHVPLIIGGHNSPESLSIAPLSKQYGVPMLAAITSNPVMSGYDWNVARITAVSTVHAALIAEYAKEQRFAIIFEETSYARPPAEKLASILEKEKRKALYFDSFAPGEIDFRSMLLQLKAQKPGAIYIGVQSPDTAALLLQQLTELKIKAQLYGNELTGNSLYSELARPEHFEGLMFPEPDFDENSKEYQRFAEAFQQRFQTPPPFGFWTAEAYDTVMLVGEALRKENKDWDRTWKIIRSTKNYRGATGFVSIQENGDGYRNYKIKVIRSGKIVALE